MGTEQQQEFKSEKLAGPTLKRATKEPTKVFRDFWLAIDIFVLVYSHETNIEHYLKNQVTNPTQSNFIVED